MFAAAPIARWVVLAMLLSAACGRHEGELLRRARHDSSPPIPEDAGGVDLQLPPADVALPQLSCLEPINALRASAGLPAYARYPEQEQCLARQVQMDAEADRRFLAYGYCGESNAIECPHYYGEPADVLDLCLRQAWQSGPGSPTHGALAGSYAAAECAAWESSDGHSWVLIDFFQ